MNGSCLASMSVSPPPPSNPLPCADTPAGSSAAIRCRRVGALGSTVGSSAMATRLVRRLVMRCRTPSASISASMASALLALAASVSSRSAMASRPTSAPIGSGVAGAAPGAGDRGGERAIGGGADADGVDAASVGQPVHDPRHHLALEANLAVGHQHDLALRVVAQAPERLRDGAGHLGAAAGGELGEG